MGKRRYEKEYDDEVYEDDYYEEHYNEEELGEESDADGDADGDSSWEDEKRVVISFACEDCDYRWEDQIVKSKDGFDDEEGEYDVICPMCGSINITQI
ncbi:MAG: hypothetical protein JXA20_12560 [Spirochaetes bacterium]|nr:hypothetical protein [Spirochaetota bacterium]